MLNRIKAGRAEDFFVELDRRCDKGVFFYRVAGTNDSVDSFLLKYYGEAKKNGVVINNGLKNPDERMISFYYEMMGKDFSASESFISSSLKKWLPRMSDQSRKCVSESIAATLAQLQAKGKNNNMLNNAYVKFMCWFYYKFERIVNVLGQNQLPKILYFGDIGVYQMLLLDVISKAGCDILIMSDDNYKKADPDLNMTDEFVVDGMKPFGPEFNLSVFETRLKKRTALQNLTSSVSADSGCTNAWLTGAVLQDVKSDPSGRGTGTEPFCNCYCRVIGVENKSEYLNDLYLLYQEMKKKERKVVVINNSIPSPTSDEISMIKRGSYPDISAMISDLSGNIRISYGQELQNLMIKTFIELMIEEIGEDESHLNKYLNRAVYLLCWLKRYQGELFSGRSRRDVSAFFFMGSCKDEKELLFIRFLARLPVDVIMFCPDIGSKQTINDPLLYDVNNVYSMEVTEFPLSQGNIRVGTVAYHAERELDTIMYDGCGIFRDQQYSKANAIKLQTMYEEIEMLWNQEMKYRPGFSIVGDTVNIPVLFSKVSGVKNNDTPAYWRSIKKLLNNETLLITDCGDNNAAAGGMMNNYAVKLFQDGKISKSKIRSDPHYRYGHLRDSIQEHLLNKLQELIDSKIIQGTKENGTEYTIVSVVLDLDNAILRMVQSFDFTKTNPKLIYLMTDEKVLSIRETIKAVYLSMIGFDVVFFVPTGYRTVEGHLAKNVIEEYQIGGYVYDLTPPDFKYIQSEAPKTFFNKLFGR